VRVGLEVDLGYSPHSPQPHPNTSQHHTILVVERRGELERRGWGLLGVGGGGGGGGECDCWVRVRIVMLGGGVGGRGRRVVVHISLLSPPPTPYSPSPPPSLSHHPTPSIPPLSHLLSHSSTSNQLSAIHHPLISPPPHTSITQPITSIVTSRSPTQPPSHLIYPLPSPTIPLILNTHLFGCDDGWWWCVCGAC
jgi:hypothetical protein